METYLITGATGYIGSMLVKDLIKTVRGVDITLIVRDKVKAKSIFDNLEKENVTIHYIVADLSDKAVMDKIEGKFDNIIHSASITKSLEMISKPTSVIESIVNSTQNILDLSLRCKAQSVVYLSSMEVYGTINSSIENKVTEDELGNIDIYDVRSCYPMAKRMAENICYCYYKEFGLPIKIARLAQTFGAGVLPGESRVFAQFANAVYKNQDIILHTRGNSVGNYCDIYDAVDGLKYLLKKGINGEAYNVVNEENTMTIGEMAELVADKIAKGNIKIKYQIPKENIYGFAKETGLRLSSAKINKLGWKAKRNLFDMYTDVLKEISE